MLALIALSQRSLATIARGKWIGRRGVRFFIWATLLQQGLFKRTGSFLRRSLAPLAPSGLAKPLNGGGRFGLNTGRFALKGRKDVWIWLAVVFFIIRSWRKKVCDEQERIFVGDIGENEGRRCRRWKGLALLRKKTN